MKESVTYTLWSKAARNEWIGYGENENIKQMGETEWDNRCIHIYFPVQ